MTDDIFHTIEDFCRAHHICKRTFHNLQSRGEGPETLKIGRRRLISEAAAQAWRSRIARPLTQEEANMIADHTVAAFPKLVAEYGEDAGAVFEQRLHTLLQAFGVLDPPELDLLAGNAGAAVAN